jgi:hypothetical protein
MTLTLSLTAMTFTDVEAALAAQLLPFKTQKARQLKAGLSFTQHSPFK